MESVNWALRTRVDDATRQEYGWSYRTSQIQIMLLQEIRDELVKQRRAPRVSLWRRIFGASR